MNTESKFWYLKHFNLLDGLDDDALMRMEGVTTMNIVQGNQPIYMPGEPSRAIFFLKKGHVKISRINVGGNEAILEVLGPGELFGEQALGAPGEERRDIAVALDEAVVCALRVADFEEILRAHPELNLKVIKRAGLRLRKYEERVSDLLFKDIRARIASFLVRYAEEFGGAKSGAIVVDSHLTHQDIAFLTGTARQSVTTVLNELRSEGALDFTRKQFIIKDIRKLKSLAGG